MNETFFNVNEDRDYNFLNEFCNQTGFFTDLSRSDKYSVIDARGYRNDRPCNIELKMRNMDMNKYDLIYIECNKVSNLFLSYATNREIPYYVNFFQDGNHIAIWNLLKLSGHRYMPSVKINNVGYERVNSEPRHLLYLRDAKIFINDGGGFKEIG